MGGRWQELTQKNFLSILWGTHIPFQGIRSLAFFLLFSSHISFVSHTIHQIKTMLWEFLLLFKNLYKFRKWTVLKLILIPWLEHEGLTRRGSLYNLVNGVELTKVRTCVCFHIWLIRQLLQSESSQDTRLDGARNARKHPVGKSYSCCLKSRKRPVAATMYNLAHT